MNKEVAKEAKVRDCGGHEFAEFLNTESPQISAIGVETRATKDKSGDYEYWILTPSGPVDYAGLVKLMASTACPIVNVATFNMF